jgi:hypothetical protein
MKKIFIILVVLFLLTVSSFSVIGIDKFPTDLNNIQKTIPKYHLVKVSITGTGYIYSTLYYMAIIPMIIIQFIVVYLERLGYNGKITNFIWNIFNNIVPDFIRDLADFKEKYLPIFFISPLIYVVQVGGGYTIGDDRGASFNGGLHGFTGVAWQNNEKIFIKGFALTANY